jgi:hypothetical protein
MKKKLRFEKFRCAKLNFDATKGIFFEKNFGKKLQTIYILN